MGIVRDILASTWELLGEAAPYMLAGFFLASLVRAFIPARAVVKLLGRRKLGSVFWAAAIGVPLPLCSCGVIPMAAALRREGASKGAVSSFVISTPESGADSIAATYALMDLPMTIARPIAAFATAFAAGAAELLLGRPSAPPVAAAETCARECDEAEEENEVEMAPRGLPARVYSSLRYAFGEMFEDMAAYLLVGFLLAGVLAALVPPAFVAERLSSATLQIVALVILGAPIYVCATAATPIAAVVVAKGISPGAALAFLLAGPATNAASLTVLTKYLGRRSAAIYLATIIILAVAGGLGLNAFYDALGLTAEAAGGTAAAEEGFDYLGTITAAAFVLLCVNGLRLKWKSRRSSRVGGR
ncbi:MAG: SO_0444 family Cu/Zn efflux transporter [candidate division Zixibacteria bacterium]|nr:SO_0444 family Cu/Zn efflux transporter [candidate division Zixibacteria bacterium]